MSHLRGVGLGGKTPPEHHPETTSARSRLQALAVTFNFSAFGLLELFLAFVVFHVLADKQSCFHLLFSQSSKRRLSQSRVDLKFKGLICISKVLCFVVKGSFFLLRVHVREFRCKC